VSQACDTDDESLIHLPTVIDRRSVVEMQRNVDKQGKRNAFVRFILAKGDKDKIAAWNQDLVRILHVFNVRLIGFCWVSANLGDPFQTELAIDTNMRVANTQTMVADARIAVKNTETIVTDTQTTVTNTETMVADIHRNMFMGQKGASSQSHLVGVNCYP
jgi:hypothetical protein